MLLFGRYNARRAGQSMKKRFSFQYGTLVRRSFSDYHHGDRFSWVRNSARVRVRAKLGPLSRRRAVRGLFWSFFLFMFFRARSKPPKTRFILIGTTRFVDAMFRERVRCGSPGRS